MKIVATVVSDESGSHVTSVVSRRLLGCDESHTHPSQRTRGVGHPRLYDATRGTAFYIFKNASSRRPRVLSSAAMDLAWNVTQPEWLGISINNQTSTINNGLQLPSSRRYRPAFRTSRPICSFNASTDGNLISSLRRSRKNNSTSVSAVNSIG